MQPCGHLIGKVWFLGSPVLFSFCHFPIRHPGSVVVLDCINSCSLPSSLLKQIHICMNLISEPQPLKSSDLSFMAITNNSFQLHWKKPTSTRVDQYKVLINSSPTDGQSEHVVPSNKTSLDFDSLLSSTRYYVQVYTMLQGKLTEMAAVGSLYTRK